MESSMAQILTRCPPSEVNHHWPDGDLKLLPRKSRQDADRQTVSLARPRRARDAIQARSRWLTAGRRDRNANHAVQMHALRND